MRLSKSLERISDLKAKSARDCRAVEADLSTLEGPQHLVDEIVRLTGRNIDILINNAGIAMMRNLKDVTLHQWNSKVNLNARGMLLLTQAVLPHFAQGSRIVNVNGVGVQQGSAGSTVYHGTKSMVESFTRCWAS